MTKHSWLRNGYVLLATLIPLTVAAESADSAGLAMAAVPADGVIRLTEYGYRDWGPELLHYRLDAKQAPAGKLVLVTPDGKRVPCQVKDGVLSFVAALQKGQTAEFRLQSAAGAPDSADLTRVPVGDTLEIANQQFGIRVPKPQQKTFKEPVPVSQVPPPLLGVRQEGFEWCGGSHLVTDRKVAEFAARIVEEGQASVLYEARYALAPQGSYLCRIRVSVGLAYAEVTEEFDFGGFTDGRDFLVLDLSAGWAPAEVRNLTSGGGDSSELKPEPLAPYLTKKAAEVTKGVANVASGTPPPMPRPGSDKLLFLERFTTTGAYGPTCGFGLAGAAPAAPAEAKTPLPPRQSLTVLPLHAGSWRRAMALTAWQDPDRGVQVALPISVRPVRWYLETTDDQSPFTTHTHDPDLPVGYGRRIWALCVGVEKPVELHARVGYVGLDRYKDWILDWPEDKGKATYPRAVTTPALAKRLQQSLDKHPEKALLEKMYVINGKPESALANAQEAIKRLRNPPNAQPWTMWGWIGYRDPDFWLWLGLAEDALAYPDLAAEQRRELRRRLALFASLYTEPDAYPFGSGIHLGTPNMRIGRGVVGIYFAALLPDHPRCSDWMTHYQAFTEYWLANNTTAGGAWFEPPIYQLYGPTRWLTTAQILLRNGGWGDLGKKGYHAAALTYAANLTMPDPRFKGWRILPGMGNSGNTLEGIWGIGMGAVEQADPETAGFLSYMHGLCSGNRRVTLANDTPEYSFFYLPDVPEKPRALGTAYIPGYGVVFRTGFGTPDETAMLFRCGYNRSHWDMDDQNVILYAKGAPLSPGAAYQYYFGIARQSGSIFNRCSIMSPNREEPNGRVQTDIQDYGFGSNAAYAVGRMYYSGEELGDGKGDMEWRRHILFLTRFAQASGEPRGTDYFVMRDTFTGFEGAPAKAGRPAFWTWLNLDTADRVKVDGVAFDAAKVAVDKLVPVEQMPVLSGRTLEMATAFGASTWFWFDTPEKLALKAVMTFKYGLSPNYHHRTFGKDLGVPSADTPDGNETKTIFRADGNTDDGFFYVVYPRKGTEPTPTCERLAPGCLKITTPESTDYVFISDTPLVFAKEGVVFEGKAGTVRVYRDNRVALCLNSGSGKVGYKGCVVIGSAGTAVAELVQSGGIGKSGEHRMAGDAPKIVTIDLVRGMSVRGELPFTAKLDGDTVRIHSEGRARQFILSWPEWLMHPQYFLDGQEWQVFVSDYASQNWGRYGRCFEMCLSTLDGTHELEIRPRLWPKPWDDGFRSALGKGR